MCEHEFSFRRFAVSAEFVCKRCGERVYKLSRRELGFCFLFSFLLFAYPAATAVEVWYSGPCRLLLQIIAFMVGYAAGLYIYYWKYSSRLSSDDDC